MIYLLANVRKATAARECTPRQGRVHFGMQIPPPLCAPPRKFSPRETCPAFRLVYFDLFPADASPLYSLQVPYIYIYITANNFIFFLNFYLQEYFFLSFFFFLGEFHFTFNFSTDFEEILKNSRIIRIV